MVLRTAHELNAEQICCFETKRKRPVNFYRVGNKTSKIKVLIKGGHEDEFTYLPSIYLIMANFLRDNDNISALLSKLDLWFLECDDPDGFDRRAWTAVNMWGEEEHWPPERFISMHKLDHPVDLITQCIGRNTINDVEGNVMWRDENGVYGDQIQSQRIANILEVIDKEVQLNEHSVAIDLHATYRSKGAWQFYHGAGILEIGHYPIAEKNHQKIFGLFEKKKPYTLTSFVSILRWLRNAIKDTPGYLLGKAAMDNVRERGFKAYGGKFQKMLEQPAIFSQLIPVDVGQTVMGKLYKEAEIRVCSEYLKDVYGSLTYTTETFPCWTTEAILQNVAYVEGLLLHILNHW